MADDFYTKWGIDPNEGPPQPDVGIGPTKSYNDDFNSKWLGEQPAGANPVQTVPITKTPEGPSTVDRIWQVITHPLVAAQTFGSNVTNPEKLQNTTLGQIVSGVASGTTLPGDVWSGKTQVDPNDPNFMGRAVSLAGITGTGGIPVVRGIPTPLINPADAKLAALAIDEYGIPIRGGQLKPGTMSNYLDNIINREKSGEQHSTFNRALSNTMGEDAPGLTPEVMANAKDRLGQNYETVAANTTLKFDQPMIDNLKGVIDGSKYLTSDEANVISKHINNIMDVAAKNDGTIPGQAYQNLIKRGSPLDVATQSSNANIKFYAGQIKDALIDGLNRYAPDDMKSLLKTTNSQYKAMKTLEPLAEKAPTGDISPALVLNQVRNKYDIAYGGGGDLADLGRIGQRFLKEPPQSGTAPRLAVSKLLTLGGLGGAEAGLAFHDPVLAAKAAAVATLGGAARWGTQKAIGSVLRSEWYRNKLINSALPDRAAVAPNQLQKLLGSNIPYLPPAVPNITIPVRPGYYQSQESL